MPVNVGTTFIETEGGPKSIFGRLGGQARLELFVDGLYNSMAKDKDTKKFFENRNMEHLKKRTVDFLGGMWGGDAYRGPDLFLAHTGLGISVHTFDVMMKCTAIQLKTMKCDPDLSRLIIRDLSGMKEPLCDPTGKLKRAQNRKNLEGGDPFDDAANRAAFAERQKAEADRRAKLEAFRKQKKKEEKEKAEKAEKAKEMKKKEKEEKAAKTKKMSDKKKETQTKEQMEEVAVPAELPEAMKDGELPGTASTSFDSEKKELSDSEMSSGGRNKYITVVRQVVSL